nr:gamma-glutamyl-gamma-aminobutyrate hydrolase family protein [Tepidibacter mesophilus]
MSKRPIIGISGSMMIDSGGMFPGYERSYVNNDYIQSVIRAGGIPFIIPMGECDEVIKQQVETIDGLILSGGHDVDSLLYNEEPTQKLGEIYPKRDEFDYRLIEYAMGKDIPILGICRGMQILNVANGGSLYQDLSFIDGCYIKHWQGNQSDVATHNVDVEKGSKLSSIIGNTFKVNSFHHLAVKDVAKGFNVCARAKDGVIEAIEKDGDTFVVGFQWHPEMMSKNNSKMQGIFKRLVEESKK